MMNHDEFIDLDPKIKAELSLVAWIYALATGVPMLARNLRRDYWPEFKFFLKGALFILALPVSVPVLAILARRELRRELAE